MKALILSTEAREDLRRVKEHAERNPFTLEALQALMADGRSPAGPEFRCTVPIGYRVAFTIECHLAGWARHLSISLAPAFGSKICRFPDSAAIALIGRELGMRLDIFDPETTTYHEGHPSHAVNVIELVRVEAKANINVNARP